MSAHFPVAPTRQAVRFAGYAAVFGAPDGSGDILHPGAFAASLAQRRGPLPLLWEHRPRMQVGVVDMATEDARGLRVIGTITLPDSRPAGLVRDGALNGLSFGYRASRYRTTARGRDLFAVDLFEISLVANPLQHGARIHLIA